MKTGCEIELAKELGFNGIELPTRKQLYEKAIALKFENADLKARLEKAIELPCKVGDMVYFLDAYDKTFRILEFEQIEKFEISDECEYAITECGNYFEIRGFGKYYFTSKTEAEKALKEKSE